jgi:uncharacterized lipoprotein YddW (UPF0748 family)
MKLILRFTILLLIITQPTFAQNYLIPKYEFRAVWVATVYNIDWPKTQTDTPEKQREDFIKITEFYNTMNFNAVIAQIRTAGDVFYPSKYEPWARYLTGKEGQAPEPFYDPTKFMVEETHKQGLEFHAWFNPYRATMTLDTTKLAPNHPFYQHRDWMIKYGPKYYFNPGLPEVQQYAINVIMEAVNQYDLDAVHFDDYFYPYKVKDEFFNDTLAYKKYGKKFKNIEDWRRDNIDQFVKKMSEAIKKVKPDVKFGISPFGVWRNREKDPLGSDTKAGQTCYDDLYADPISWIKNGWIDYIIPQAYWSIGFEPASYSKLTEWWASQPYEVALYMGQGPYKVNNNADKSWENPEQISNQVVFNRLLPKVKGSAFFSAKSLIDNPLNVAYHLKTNVFSKPALVPVHSRDKDKPLPNAPIFQKIKKRRKATTLTWKVEKNNNNRYSLIYKIPKDTPVDLEKATYLFTKIPYQAEKSEYEFTDFELKAHKNYKYIITVVDKFHLESKGVLSK